jgi:aspartate/glutamate racemase
MLRPIRDMATIRREGGHNTAELLINSMNIAFSAACVIKGRWDELGAYLAERAIALENGGAYLIICVRKYFSNPSSLILYNPRRR